MEGAVTITDLTWVKRGSGQLVARESARNAVPFVQPGVNINIGFGTIENQFKIHMLVVNFVIALVVTLDRYSTFLPCAA